MPIVVIMVSSFVTAAELSAQTTFDQLKTLEGKWRSTSGGTATSYKVIAIGSSLVETWTMSPARQSMTVYAMDGDRVLATHHCPQANIPRLEVAVAATDRAHFSSSSAVPIFASPMGLTNVPFGFDWLPMELL